MCALLPILPMSTGAALANFSNTSDLLLITVWQQSAHPPPDLQTRIITPGCSEDTLAE